MPPTAINERSRPRQNGNGSSNRQHAGQATVDTRSVRQRCEYQVEWIGPDGTTPHARILPTRAAANKLVARLEDRDGGRGQPAAHVTLTVRTVGAWREVLR